MKKEVKIKKNGKTILNIKLKKGGLMGYKINDPIQKKRQALDRLVKKDGYSTIVKRLNILAIYNKNRYPQYTRKIRNDISYLQSVYKTRKVQKKKPLKSPRKYVNKRYTSKPKRQ